MIIRASEDFRRIFLAVDSTPTPEEESLPPVIIMTPNGPIRQKSQRQTTQQIRDAEIGDLYYLRDLTPQWLSEALVTGSIITVNNEDYAELCEEVQDQLEIIS